MFRKVLFFLIASAIAHFGLSLTSRVPMSAEVFPAPLTRPLTRIPRSTNFSTWFIEDEASAWPAEERAVVATVLANTLGALESAGLDGAALLEGYRFRRFDGQYAKDKEGNIALVNHGDLEITLSDTVLLPENRFFIYHELGHVVNHRSGGELNNRFHALTLQIEGVTALHDWTTAQGFFMRGQAHVHKTEATADAFALWVWVAFAKQETPYFHDTPENANAEAIVEIFSQAFVATFGESV